MNSPTTRSILDRLLEQGPTLQSEGAVRSRGAALGGAAAGLLALLSGGRRRGFGRNALLLGGLGALGKVALDAWNRREHAPPSDRPFGALEEEAEAEARAETLLLAMVAAAKADGHIDEEEESAIAAEMEDLPIAVREMLANMVAQPADPSVIAARARGEQERHEIYAASALLCGRDHPAEVAYLDRLAAALGLSLEEARDIEDSLMAL